MKELDKITLNKMILQIKEELTQLHEERNKMESFLLTHIREQGTLPYHNPDDDFRQIMSISSKITALETLLK